MTWRCCWGGDGRFAAAQAFAIDTADSPNSVTVADLNGDGHLDLITANSILTSCDEPQPRGDVAVLLGRGDGTFAAAQIFAVPGSGPNSVAVADLNGDGQPDLVTANPGSNDVSVLLGRGDAIFAAAQAFAVGSGPFSVAVADLNRDGHPDLVIANTNSNHVSVLLSRR